MSYSRDVIMRAWVPHRLATMRPYDHWWQGWRWGCRLMRLWRGHGYEYYPTWYAGD
jgi:hypothetical protein